MKSRKHKLTATIQNLENAHRVERRGKFVYRPSEENVPVRNRRTLENANLRKINFSAPEELRAAIVGVVTEHIGTEEAETISSVAKMLGASNSKAFQSVVSQQIEKRCGESAISERAGKLFVC